MATLPTWAVYAVSFGSPAAAFLGVVIGHLLSRRGAFELDRRARREESMRTLRWASELAVAGDGRSVRLGIAALDALSVSPWLQSEDQAFVDAVLDALLERGVRVYREAAGPGRSEVGLSDGAATGDDRGGQEEER